MIITILTDNTNSWYIPFGKNLSLELEELGHQVHFVNSKNEIVSGDICFLLSCSRIIQKEFLNRNKSNIVVHASDLPQGKGFSPLQWQILEGKNEITLTLFEVVEAVDAGPFYLKDKIYFNGLELYDELREKLATKLNSMCITYVKGFGKLVPINQSGDESFYRKRTELDDEINIDATIEKLFNHFRIADNDNYPLWFRYKGKKYIIKIYSDNSH